LKKFQHIVYLNSNNAGKSLLAVGKLDQIKCTIPKSSFSELKAFQQKYKNEYIFGYLTYDLKNDLENLTSKNTDSLNFPALYFFVPESVAEIQNEEIQVLKGNKPDLEKVWANLSTNHSSSNHNKTTIKSTASKQAYLENVKEIKRHIRIGDIYEANYCYAFEGHNVDFDTLSFYKKINKNSQAPFSVFAKFGTHEIAGASPERYLEKKGNTLISQPIKGTIKRGDTYEEDQELITKLKNNQKDKSENVMIVDLVRNDLSKIATKSSVKVTELCEIYSFDTLHQMISTVKAEVKNDTNPIDILQATFPMGSMTGAPKISAMQIIEQYESTKRGLYSGAIGYFAPNGDFDFNVVIRSLLFNKKTGNLSLSVGGAITDLSDPVEEYNETLLKAAVFLNELHES